MPNGNVGTSLTTFMSLIRSCQLPPNVIRKLGLSFPSSRSKHCYGNVRFDYANVDKGSVSLCQEEGISEDVANLGSKGSLADQTSDNYNSSGPLLRNNKQQSMSSKLMQNTDKLLPNNATNMEDRGEQSKKQFNSDADDNEQSSDTESEPEEDWERHEALHDDVDCQARTKERLFENKIELKWEKGGSGLAFYTDAAYWDSLNGDFDEQTADDWDIDMHIYEKGGKYYSIRTQN